MTNATQVVTNGVTYVGDGIQKFINPGKASSTTFYEMGSNSVLQAMQPSIQQVKGFHDFTVSYFEKPICDEAKKSGEEQDNVDSKKGADEGTASSYEEAKSLVKRPLIIKRLQRNPGIHPWPRESTPNSSTDLKDGDKVTQRRYYGSDGKAEYDIDYTDHGNPARHPNVPHGHQWRWDIDSKNPPRPQVPFPFP